MRLEIIHGAQIIIIALLAYIPTITISGWFEAWVAKKNGDDLPEQFGFLTLDPMMHFNVVGFGFLLVGALFGNYLPFFKDIPGWGRFIPINPSPHSGRKAILQFTARATAHFTMLLLAFFTVIFFFQSAYVQHISSNAGQASSFIDSLFSVLIFFYRQNSMLCVIYAVIGLFRSLLFFYFPTFNLFSTEHVLWAIILLMISVILGAMIVEFLLASFMGYLTYLFIAR